MEEAEDLWKFRIDVPEELKYVLVSDRELITVKKALFGLPAKHSVTSILQEYTKHVEKSHSAQCKNFSIFSRIAVFVKNCKFL